MLRAQLRHGRPVVGVGERLEHRVPSPHLGPVVLDRDDRAAVARRGLQRLNVDRLDRVAVDTRARMPSCSSAPAALSASSTVRPQATIATSSASRTIRLPPIRTGSSAGVQHRRLAAQRADERDAGRVRHPCHQRRGLIRVARVQHGGAVLRRHRADDSVAKAIGRLIRADLIVIDDIGMLPVAPDAAEALFRVVDAAYEKRSIALTSNIRPAGFDELMPKTLAAATVDRLLHHAHVLLTDGTDSYRLAQATAGKGVMPLT
jgi:hypothetical protein